MKSQVLLLRHSRSGSRRSTDDNCLRSHTIWRAEHGVSRFYPVAPDLPGRRAQGWCTYLPSALVLN